FSTHPGRAKSIDATRQQRIVSVTVVNKSSLVGLNNPAIAREKQNDVARVFRKQLVAGQGCFGLLALGDIQRNALHKETPAGFIAHHARRIAQPDHTAIARERTELKRNWRVARLYAAD